MTQGERRRAARPGYRAGSTVVGIVVWLVAPLLLVAGLTWVSAQQKVSGNQVPVWVPAEPGGSDVQRQISVVLSWAEPEPILAPEWSGTVRDVYVTPGDVVSSGDKVVRIDAVTRLAWHTDAPFYRSLERGATGDDVIALNTLLAARGLDHSETGGASTFSDATRRGVEKLAQQLGAGTTPVFSPDWIVYLPADSIEIATVEVGVSAPAPSAGTPVLTREPAAVSGRLALLETEQDFGAAPQASADENLIVGETSIELSQDRDALSPQGLEVLSQVVGSGSESVTGVLVRHVEGEVVEIPTAAVHTDAFGSTCVLVRSSERIDGSVRTIPVTVVAGLAGRSVVSGDLTTNNQVGVGAIRQDETCG